jgi:hypothetical protein
LFLPKFPHPLYFGWRLWRPSLKVLKNSAGVFECAFGQGVVGVKDRRSGWHHRPQHPLSFQQRQRP